MEWVAIDVHIAGDAVTHRLAEQFRVRIGEAAGLLTLAFAGMAQHAQDGDLTAITDSQIEAWAFWHGKRGAFAAFFRAQLCDEGDPVVRAWEKYNGAAMREAKASRERSRQWRDARRADRAAEADDYAATNGVGNGVPNGAPNAVRDGVPNGAANGKVRRSELSANGSTGQDRTGQDHTTSETPGETLSLAEQVEQVLAGYRQHHPRRRPGDKERKAVRRALVALGYSVAELLEAIAGNAADPWHIERAKHELSYVLRDNGMIDGFREQALRPAVVTPESRARVLLDLCRRYDLFTYGGDTAAYEAKLVTASADPLAGPAFRVECRAVKPWNGLDAPSDHLKAAEIERRLATVGTVAKGATS